MMGQIILAVFGVAWGVAALMFVIAPVPAMAWMQRVLRDPWWRFWIAQAVLLLGLLLIIDTASLEGRWLWVACGGIGVVKACLLLGASESRRERVWEWFGRWPVWLIRCDGAVELVVAVLLAADVMLHG